MKYISNIIAIAIIAGLVYAAVQFKQSDAYHNLRLNADNFFKRADTFVKVRKNNISMEIAPVRKRHISMLEVQANLENWMPQVFGALGDEDWRQFWDFIYEPISEKQGGFTVKRYHTRQEAESYLKNKYPDLSYLRENDWSEVWGIAKVPW
ncbi:MAG: hypothetical protein PHU64_03455 [Candidatus Omnitrophica bacterium]|nr:hypothetical protein [Candidatus Omnitrophota bacterium]MDD5430023.1 hypothetical protein [Candidatus Omnitrophota bacterium]